MATYTDNYQLAKPVGSDVARISTLNSNSDKIDTILHATQVSLADAYDQNATYAVGDMVMYEFYLYECITAVDTPETFDPTKWQRATASTSGGGGGEGGSSTLAGLTDVNLISPTDGQGLVYDATNQQWINGDVGGGGTGGGKVDELYTSSVQETGTITLANPYTDYDFLEITLRRTGDAVFCFTQDCSEITTGDLIGGGIPTQNDPYIWYSITSSTVLTYVGQSGGFYVSRITGVKNGGAGELIQPVIYSTEEREIGVWIDGSTLYQKTIDFGTLPAVGGTGTVAHGISNMDILVNAVFTVRSASPFYARTLPAVSRGAAASQTTWFMDETYIYVLSGSEADVNDTWTGTVTIQYTKTS